MDTLNDSLAGGYAVPVAYEPLPDTERDQIDWVTRNYDELRNTFLALRHAFCAKGKVLHRMDFTAFCEFAYSTSS